MSLISSSSVETIFTKTLEVFLWSIFAKIEVLGKRYCSVCISKLFSVIRLISASQFLAP